MRRRSPEEWMDLVVALPLALFVFGSGIFFLLRWAARLLGLAR